MTDDANHTITQLPPSRGPLWDAGFEAAREHYAAEIARLRAELERERQRAEDSDSTAKHLFNAAMDAVDHAGDGNPVRKREARQMILDAFPARDNREGGEA